MILETLKNNLEGLKDSLKNVSDVMECLHVIPPDGQKSYLVDMLSSDPAPPDKVITQMIELALESLHKELQDKIKEIVEVIKIQQAREDEKDTKKQ